MTCVPAAELPRVFQDSSASDLRGADLPSFLTLVDKATDPEFQERLQGSKAKLAQLQQPGERNCCQKLCDGSETKQRELLWMTELVKERPILS